MYKPISLTIEAVKKLNPCSSDYRRVAGLLPKRCKINAAKARELGCTYGDIIWIASAIAQDNEDMKRRLTHYINDNAKAVLHIFERAAPEDGRVRDCIQATDDFLDGKITEEKWSESARAACDAWAACDTWDARAAWAAWAAWDAWAACAARAAFKDLQFDRLIYWLTEEKPKPLPIPKKGVPALAEIEKLDRSAA